MLYVKVVKRGNPKSSHHTHTFFFSVSLIWHLYEMFTELTMIIISW